VIVQRRGAEALRSQQSLTVNKMTEKIALVTGASGGIGSQICALLAAQNIQLILVDRDQAKTKAFVDGLDPQVRNKVRATFAVDLTDRSDIKMKCARIVEQFPAIDFLFNNAGVLTETLIFAPNGNELHFEVNTLAPLQIIDQLRPSLKGAPRAVVVSTTAGLSLRAKTLDMNELRKPTSFQKLFGPYVNSKAALNVLTAALAVELSPDGIDIRAADPGPNRTALTKGAGTPLWMRLFYMFLPAPVKGAQKIVDAALSSRWSGTTGVMISDGAAQSLPDALSDKNFQRGFLASCRQLILEQPVPAGTRPSQ
jgi:NAD(P)-dependent dehydrogenase (short-subunit alcohol dehydrogenase family)